MSTTAVPQSVLSGAESPVPRHTRRHHHRHHHHHHSTEQPPAAPERAGELVTTPVSGADAVPESWARTLRAVELLDADCAAEAKCLVDVALGAAPHFVPLLLLARYLALSRPALFAADEPSPGELRVLVEQAGAAQREEALAFRELAAREVVSPTAMFLTALIVDKVAASDAGAFRWYMRAALLGCAEAQFSVGFMFTRGIGVPENPARAAAWYAKAAAAGRPNAQNNLALLYLSGTGVRRDRRRALQLLRQAAAQGHETAVHNLAVLKAQPRLRAWQRRPGAPDGFALASGDTGQAGARDDVGGSEDDEVEQCALNGSGKGHTKKRPWHVLALFR